jgi:hypothetical protein
VAKEASAIANRNELQVKPFHRKYETLRKAFVSNQGNIKMQAPNGQGVRILSRFHFKETPLNFASHFEPFFLLLALAYDIREKPNCVLVGDEADCYRAIEVVAQDCLEIGMSSPSYARPLTTPTIGIDQTTADLLFQTDLPRDFSRTKIPWEYGIIFFDKRCHNSRFQDFPCWIAFSATGKNLIAYNELTSQSVVIDYQKSGRNRPLTILAPSLDGEILFANADIETSSPDDLNCGKSKPVVTLEDEYFLFCRRLLGNVFAMANAYPTDKSASPTSLISFNLSSKQSQLNG